MMKPQSLGTRAKRTSALGSVAGDATASLQGTTPASPVQLDKGGLPE